MRDGDVHEALAGRVEANGGAAEGEGELEDIAPAPMIAGLLSCYDSSGMYLNRQP